MKFFYKSILGLVLLLTPVIIILGESEGNKIYRVYIDDEMIGVLSDLSIYEEYQENQMREYLSEYSLDEIIEPSNVRIEEEITYVKFKNDDEEIIKEISERATFKTNAHTVRLGNSTMCVKEVEDVSSEIERILKTLIPEDEIADLDLLKGELLDESTEIKEGITGIRFEPKATYTSAICSLDDIVEGEELGNLILTGFKEPQIVATLEEGSTLQDMIEESNLTPYEFYLLNYRRAHHKIPYVGQSFNVTPIQDDVKILLKQNEVKEEVIAYRTEVIEDNELPVGELATQQEGQNGVKLTTYNQTYMNGVLASEVKADESIVSEPQNRIVIKGTKEIPSRGTKDWHWPTTKTMVTCGYLCYSGHYAIDIGGPVGQPIFAADNGVVISAGWDGGYGYSILINHNNGYYTRYAHMSTLGVKVGDIVGAGQTIGGLGNTGNSTGPHLHFEIRTDTNSQPSYAPNPLDFY